MRSRLRNVGLLAGALGVFGLASPPASAAPLGATVLGSVFVPIAGNGTWCLNMWEGSNCGAFATYFGAQLPVSTSLAFNNGSELISIEGSLTSASSCYFVVLGHAGNIIQTGASTSGKTNIPMQLGEPTGALGDSIQIVCHVETGGTIYQAWQ
jgi:hypothetical protein